MAKKEFTYYGKKLDELQKMSIKEFAVLLPSRQRRSIERGFTDTQKILIKTLEKKDQVKTHCRELVVLPNMVGKTILVYNGKTYAAVRVMEEMIGRVLGEFVLTRKRVSHSAPGVGATRSSASISVR